MVKTLAVIIILIAFSSCSPGMYEMLSRTLNDPVVVPPRVESLAASNTIFISWDFDEGADEFILERAVDSPFLYFEEIYRGTSLGFVDRNLPEGRYIYRLSKRRGREIFGPSPRALGVSSLVVRDIFRNYSRENALQLGPVDIIANIYYFRSYCGLELINEDWFFIDIPSLWRVALWVDDSDARPGNTATHFMYSVYTRESGPVLQLAPFWIVNPKLVTTRYYLKLFPARREFLDDGVPGGSIVQYRIGLTQKSPI
ncbi:MAG: hypothetical protein FWC97_01055 [Treponema sp.]|nr:hypothetical protein [Treponema sp.]